MGRDSSGHDDEYDDEFNSESLSDQAFGETTGVAAEGIAALAGIDAYISNNFSQIGAYAQAGFAVGEFAANNLGLDVQAMFAPIGAIGGVALGGALEAITDGVNSLLAAESSGNAEEAEEAIEEIDAACQGGGQCFVAGTQVLMATTEGVVVTAQTGEVSARQTNLKELSLILAAAAPAVYVLCAYIERRRFLKKAQEALDAIEPLEFPLRNPEPKRTNWGPSSGLSFDGFCKILILYNEGPTN
jgi:hypothetical protein